MFVLLVEPMYGHHGAQQSKLRRISAISHTSYQQTQITIAKVYRCVCGFCFSGLWILFVKEMQNGGLGRVA